MQPKLISFPLFGYAALEVWAFCMIYSGDLGAGYDPLVWVAVSGVVSLATLAVLMLAPRIDAITDHRPLTIGATVLNVAGSALMLYGSAPLDLIGFVVVSVGNGWLWVAWGDIYSRMDTQTAESSAIGSAFLQVLLVVVVVLLGRFVGGAPILFAAPLSCVLYCLATRIPLDDAGEAETDDARVLSDEIPQTALLLIAGLGAPVLLLYIYWGAPFIGGTLSEGEMNGVVVVGLLVFVTVFLGFIRFIPSISIPFICRLELSLVVAGCLLGCMGYGDFAGRVAIYAAMIVSQYLRLLYGARLFRNGFGSATFTFAVIELINHTAGCLGSVVPVVLVNNGALDSVTLPYLWCVVCAVAFFVIVAMWGSDDSVSSRVGSSDACEAGAIDTNTVLLEIAGRYSLTPRETDVFLLLAKGRSAPFIRDELVISLSTVTSHMQHIYRKMGLHSRQELLDLVATGQGEQ